MKTYNYKFENIAALDDWLSAIKQPASIQSILVQLYTGILNIEEVAQVAQTITAHFSDAVIIGASTSGEILDGKMYDESIVISLSFFEKSRLKSTLIKSDNAFATGEELAKRFLSSELKAIIVFADGFHLNGDQILKGVGKHISNDVVIAGGLAGDNGLFEKSFIIYGTEVMSKAAVGVALYGKELEIFHTYNLSWLPVGKKMRVTKSEGSRVYELNAMPVKQMYRRYLGDEIADHLPESAMEFPLIYQKGELLVARAIVSAFEDGSLQFAGDIPEGEWVQFGIGNSGLLANNARTNLLEAKNAPIESHFIYSCTARKAFLGKSLESEFSLLCDIGTQAGFFTYGEFFHHTHGNELLNVTTTILGLSESKDAKHPKADTAELKDKNRRSLQALMHLIDVTTQELTLEQSKRSDEHKLFEQYKQGVDDTLIVSKTDIKGNITYVNKHFCDVSGYGESELVGKNHRIVKHPDGAKSIYKDLWKSILEKRMWQGVLKNRKKDGSAYYVKSTIIPLLDSKGEIDEFIAFRENITDIIYKTRVIEEQKGRYDKFFASIPLGIAINDMDGKFLQINKAMTVITGYSLEELKKRTNWDITPHKYRELETIQMHNLHRKNLFGPYEKEYIHKDGHKIPVLLSGTLIKDEDGQEKIWSVIQDISHLKQVEHDLIIAKDHAEHASLAKSEFLANMSHEIRTPMNGIIGFTTLLANSALSSDQQRKVSIIEASAKTLLSIVNDILDFSKIESGKLTVDPIDINPFVEFDGILKNFETAITEKKLRFQSYIDPLLSESIKIDMLRVKQVMLNLIGNAIKFTPIGGAIDVTFKRLSHTKRKDRLLFEVIDTGIGIPKERQEHIFEAFSQVDSSTTRKFGGTGLGLSISSSLVAMMGSKLQLESDEGIGSRFYFELDVEADHSVKKLSQLIEQRHICVIEDTYDRHIDLLTQLKNLNIPYKQCQQRLSEINAYRKWCKIILKFGTDHLDEVFQEMGSSCDLILLDIKASRELLEQKRVRIIDDYSQDPSQLYNVLLELNMTTQEESRIRHEYRKINLKVLVAEDYEINKLLIEELLKAYGIEAEFAVNGEEAVSMVANGTYDLLFMDINMPVMNGIDATHIIRNELHSSIPIIALTANALDGDQKRFLEAGMDAYLSKPVDVKQLETILMQYQVSPGEKQSTPQMINEIQESILFMQEKMGFKKEVTMKMLESLFSTIFERVTSLIESSKNHDYKMIYFQAHTIKGACATFKFEKIEKLAKLLEDNAQNKSAMAYETYSKELQILLQKLHVEYEALKD